VENYFNYFTEIEERFQQRRGTTLLLSTLDWALIETWKDAGIPLEAALRGIDATFDRYESRRSRVRKINSLAYCAQEVLAEAESMKEAAVGASGERQTEKQPALPPAEIATFLEKNAAALEKASLPASVSALAREAATSLRELATGVRAHPRTRLEDLERRLTVLEEKLFAALLAATPDDELLRVREEADRDIAPFRRKMPAAQLDQLQRQYVHKRVLDKYGLPRLSLFYM
jgi:hypothetical protein